MGSDNLSFILFALCILAILGVAIRQNLFRDMQDMARMVKIGRHNIEYRISPDRKKPLILADREIGLRLVYPEFFDKFDKQDWQEFWDIIYGVHPLIGFEDEKFTPAERNYYVAEIQKILVKRYPEGFSHFDQERWMVFWKQIFSVSPGIEYSFEEEEQRQRSDRILQRKLKKDDVEISSTIKDVREEIGK